MPQLRRSRAARKNMVPKHAMRVLSATRRAPCTFRYLLTGVIPKEQEAATTHVHVTHANRLRPHLKKAAAEFESAESDQSVVDMGDPRSGRQKVSTGTPVCVQRALCVCDERMPLPCMQAPNKMRDGFLAVSDAPAQWEDKTQVTAPSVEHASAVIGHGEAMAALQCNIATRSIWRHLTEFFAT